MIRRSSVAVLSMLMALGAGLAQAELPAHPEAKRVISIGGEITEIINELGATSRLIGRDTTSNYPPEIEKLPDIGYIRALSPEGVLSLDPDLIISAPGAGPVEAVDVLRNAGIPFIEVPGADTPEGIADKIKGVGQVLGKTAEAEALASKVLTGLEAVRSRSAAVPVEQRKKVLFLLSMQSGRIMAGGGGSSAEAMIEMAGGINAATGFDGYKQMADEALLDAAPDVILMMTPDGDVEAANAAVLANAAIAQTPAGASATIIRMEGMLMLGFGPRTPEAVGTLYEALYGSSE